MRREHKKDEIQPSVKTPYFYASLLTSTTAETSYEYGGETVNSAPGASISQDGLYINSSAGYILWNCNCPVNTDITFSCWVKKTGGSGVYYSFGTGTTNNARYKGLQYSTFTNAGTIYLLMTEYTYFFAPGAGSQYPSVVNEWSFITWSIQYNGNNNYTVKFYKNGTKIYDKTFSQGSWQGMSDSKLAIGHNSSNNMAAYYKHFSCYPMLTDDEVLTLYQNGGIPE